MGTLPAIESCELCRRGFQPALRHGVDEGSARCRICVDSRRIRCALGQENELLGLLAPMRDDIVEVESSETGTELPETYQPARHWPKKRDSGYCTGPRL